MNKIKLADHTALKDSGTNGLHYIKKNITLISIVKKCPYHTLSDVKKDVAHCMNNVSGNVGTSFYYVKQTTPIISKKFLR